MKKTLFLLLALSGIAATRAATLDTFTQIDLSNLGSNNTYTVETATAPSAWSISLTIDAGTLRKYVELATPVYHPTFAETPYYKGGLISGDAASGLQIVDATLSNNNRIGLDTNFNTVWPPASDATNSGSPVYNQYSHQGSISASGIYGSWNGGGNNAPIGNYAMNSVDFTTLDWDNVGTVAVTMTYAYGTSNNGIGTGLAISVYDQRGNLLESSYGTNAGLRTNSALSAIQFNDAVTSAYLYTDRITAEDAATINDEIGLAQIGATKWNLTVNTINDIIIEGDTSRRNIDWAVTATYELATSQSWENSENKLWESSDTLIETNGLITITAAAGATADLSVSGAERFLINKEGAITRITGLNDVQFSNMALTGISPSTSPNLKVEHAAIEIGTGSELYISDNSGSVSFKDYDYTITTKVAANGGAFWLGDNNATLDISRNAGGVVFQNISLKHDGGTYDTRGVAIYDQSSPTTTYHANVINICGNGVGEDGISVLFDNISAESKGGIYGGAIYLKMGQLQISENKGNVVFSSNSISAEGTKNVNGGAIYMAASSIVHIDNNKGDVVFSGNTATSGALSSYGAAVYGTGGATTSFSASGNSGQVAFTDNVSSGKTANGAAIYMASGSIMLDNNGSVLISGNHADNVTTSYSKMYGGAIYSSGLLSISGNTGSVTIQDNYLSTEAPQTTVTNSVMGGAIYSTSKAMTLSHNAGGISITGNHVDATGVSASAYVGGGAIYATNAPLVMEGNGDVEFSGNYVRLQDSVSFNAVTMKPTKASTDATPIMQLAAAEGKSITFRDSVILEPSKTTYTQVVSLNADYTDAGGKTSQATGDIVFTGKDAAGNDTAQRIVNLKTTLGMADTTASADEIRASQTSKLNAAVKLHNGTLRVEDGAELQLTSLSIAESATVKLTNGALTLGGSVTLRSGSTTGLVSDVLLENGKIDGEGSHAAMSDVFISAINEAFSISDVSMENVHFESELTTLTLTNVSFDNGSSFSVGETGIIILDNAIVNYSLDNLTSSSGVFTADLTELFHCSTQGQLELNIDTEALAQHGYTGLAVQFGEDVNADAMAIRLNGITYDYAGAVDSNGAPSFSINIIPEPASSTLSLLALAGLAARRRRK